MGGVVVANQPGVFLVDEDGNLSSVTDGATIGTAEAVIIAGKDGTVARYLKVAADGALQVDVESSALPAGAATEATLVTADGRLATIDSVVDSIKDTDGIKKITDELPAGTQEIGAVAQGTKAAAADAWPTALYDASGNPVAVVLDNSIYRLETRSTIAGQVAGTGAEVKVTTIADTEEAGEHRLQTESRIAPGSIINIGTAIPADPAALEIGFCENGGSENMLVDGDPTPVVFAYTPPTGEVVAVQSVLVVFTSDDFSFDGVSFGPNAALTTGIKFETDIGGVVTEIFNIKQNEDFIRIPGRIPLVNNTGPKDLLGVAFVFGGLIKLDEAAGDGFLVTVRDDLTSVKFKYLTTTVYGAIV